MTKVKILFVQSILRVVFSDEKDNFICQNNFEILFLKNVIYKSVSYYKNKYGDKIFSMFREDQIFDDIIKYMLYVYGNSMLNKTMS